MNVCAVVVAAGKGRRFGGRISKPLCVVSGIPVLIRSLRVLQECTSVSHIVIVASKENRKHIEALLRSCRIRKVIALVKGGRRRQDSVSAGLSAVPAQDKLVLIHDAARPFIDKDLVRRVINAAVRSKAAICAVPVKATVKTVSPKGFVTGTLQRQWLWEVQTPQVFDRELIMQAHARFGKADVTDDASLVEKMDKKVSVVMGSYDNIKITTPEDALFAAALAKR